jgi:hypothetical protein
MVMNTEIILYASLSANILLLIMLLSPDIVRFIHRRYLTGIDENIKLK